MNDYFLKILIRERQQQVAMDAGSTRLSNVSRDSGPRPDRSVVNRHNRCFRCFKFTTDKVSVISIGKELCNG